MRTKEKTRKIALKHIQYELKNIYATLTWLEESSEVMSAIDYVINKIGVKL